MAIEVFRNRFRLGDVRNSLLRPESAYVASILILAGFVYSHIGGYPMRIYDEAIYATVSMNMLHTGDFLVPEAHFQIGAPAFETEPFLEKPPLMYWLMAASMSIFGVGEFGARVPSATFAVFSCLLVYWIGKTEYSARAGFFAAVVLITTPSLFNRFNGGRMAAMDTALMFFSVVFIYAIWRAVTTDSPRLFLVAGVSIGLGFLVKGFAVGVYPLLILPIAIVYRGWVDSKYPYIGATFAIGLATAWMLLMFVLQGQEFVDQFIIDQVFDRATSSTGDPDAIFPFMGTPYFRDFLFKFVFQPWTYFSIPAGIGVVAGSKLDGDRSVSLFFIWWAIFVLVFFAFTGNHIWYIMPMFPPLALLVGKMIDDGLDGYLWARVGMAVGVALTLLVSDVLPFGSTRSYLLIVSFVGFLLFSHVKRISEIVGHSRVIMTVVCITAGVGAVGGLVGSPDDLNGDQYHHSLKSMGDTLEADSDPDDLVFVADNLGYAIHTFTFYAGPRVEYRHGDVSSIPSDASYGIILQSDRDTIDRDHELISQGVIFQHRTNQADANLSLLKFER